MTPSWTMTVAFGIGSCPLPSTSCPFRMTLVPPADCIAGSFHGRARWFSLYFNREGDTPCRSLHCDSSVVPRQPQPVQLRVPAAGFQELRMGALLHEPAVLEDENPGGVADS